MSSRRSSHFFTAFAAVGFAVATTGCDKVSAFVEKIRGKSGEKTAVAPPATALLGGTVHTVSGDEAASHMLDPNRLVVVIFYADWCAPCRQLAPVMESLAREFPANVLFVRVNVDQNKAFAQQHGVRSIPDLRLVRQGKQVERMGPADANTIRNRIAANAPDAPVHKLAPAPPPAANPAPKAAAEPPRSGPLGLLDKLRGAVSEKDEELEKAAAQVQPAVGPDGQPVAPAGPPIRPIDSQEEWLPPGMSRAKPGGQP